MTVTYIRQDFLRVTPDMGIAVQVVNAAGTIGGLTKALCSKFDGLAEMLTPTETTMLDIGSVIVYDTRRLLLAAVVAQVFPGLANDLDTYEQRRRALYDGLMFTCEANPGRALYVPYMLSCGQAGDDWLLIEALLDGLPNDVNVCVPNWAESAAELLGRLPLSKPVTELVAVDAPLSSYRIAA